MATKKLKLRREDLRTLVKGLGGCIASDAITVDGEPVRYMVRDEPRNAHDSGWSFFAGTESQAYMDDPANFAVYDVNTIANYDPDIVPLLGAKPGSRFERKKNEGPLVPCKGTKAPPPSKAGGLHPDFPHVEGDYALTKRWQLTLPVPFARRVEDGALVLWRPGITFWLNAWNNDRGEPRAKRLAHFKKAMSPDARDVREADRDGLTRFAYRLTEDAETITAFVFADDGHLQLSAYFDHEGDAAIAWDVVESVTAR